MKMKILSIVVPLYNSEHYLPKCLDSLLQQDIPAEEYEIILVNDGSPDGSLAVAEKYADCYNNITVVSQQNKGTSGARNTGLRIASGKYVYFVDPDDYILENSLKIILDQMERESLDVIRFGYTEVDEQYHPTKSCKHPEIPDYSPKIMDGATFMADRLGVACYVWTFFFRTSVIKDNDIYFIEGDYFDDTPWLPRVLMNSERVNSVDFKRHFYLIRSDSLVQSQNHNTLLKKIKGERFLIKELNRQSRSIENKQADIWYNRMIGHCVLTLLSLATKYDEKEVESCISLIKKEGILPLSTRNKSLTIWIKTILVNISPRLFCSVIKFRTHNQPNK